ncbi:MAG: ATP-dependent DNA helicase RecG [Bacillota bacterium]
MSQKIPESVQFIKGVGPKRAEILAKLDIHTVEDLLYYFPRTYEDRSKVKNIHEVTPGEEVTLKVKVLTVNIVRPKKGLSILRVSFSDGKDSVNGVWYNQPYLNKKFEKGDWYYIYGEINEKSWKFNKVEINNPVFEKVEGENIHTSRVVPIYPLTSNITQKRIRKIIYYALKEYVVHIDDIIPSYIKEKYNFISLRKSLWGFHFPQNRRHYIDSRKRLAFEELFLLQLLILKRKTNFSQKKGISHRSPKKMIKDFIDSLDFNLTSAQKKAWSEIKTDMETGIPMQRLLQGDVGSGKTIVAVLALIETIANGYQGVFMAPTEILAEQHYYRLIELMENFDCDIELLIGSLERKKRDQIEKNIAENKIDIIVGTHALFQKRINYNKIGLTIIDEQHRFGVEQRHKLKNKGNNPDLLVMTATPIPRSLALTLYGDLDLSFIDELPPGRKPVVTKWRKKESRKKVYNFVKKKLNEGRQAFVVCPLIEPSEEIDAISTEKLQKLLKHKYLKKCKIGIMHSRLASEDKKITMEEFRRGNIQVLISTTVIEVGVDVPNATIMIIENAERFGLAQLHQLRGRVGRGKNQSYCIAIGNPGSEEGHKRLKVFSSTTDGFKIAEQDLKIRGPGEFFGTRQHGIPDLQVANIVKDKKMLSVARKEAKNIISRSQEKTHYDKLWNRVEEMELKL